MIETEKANERMAGSKRRPRGGWRELGKPRSHGGRHGLRTATAPLQEMDIHRFHTSCEQRLRINHI
jgi:hypothetical protein